MKKGNTRYRTATLVKNAVSTSQISAQTALVVQDTHNDHTHKEGSHSTSTQLLTFGSWVPKSPEDGTYVKNGNTRYRTATLVKNAVSTGQIAAHTALLSSLSVSLRGSSVGSSPPPSAALAPPKCARLCTTGVLGLGTPLTAETSGPCCVLLPSGFCCDWPAPTCSHAIASNKSQSVTRMCV